MTSSQYFDRLHNLEVMMAGVRDSIARDSNAKLYYDCLNAAYVALQKMHGDKRLWEVNVTVIKPA